MCDQKELQTAFEVAMVIIQTACEAEKYMLLEIVEGSMNKIQIDDEVRYTDKYWRTKTAQMGNNPMIVTDVDGPTVYNSQTCQFLQTSPSVMEIVPLLESAGKSLSLSKPVTINLVSSIVSPAVSEQFKIRAMKCLLNNIDSLAQVDQSQLDQLNEFIAKASDDQWTLLSEVIKVNKEQKTVDKLIGEWSSYTINRNGKI